MEGQSRGGVAIKRRLANGSRLWSTAMTWRLVWIFLVATAGCSSENLDVKAASDGQNEASSVDRQVLEVRPAELASPQSPPRHCEPGGCGVGGRPGQTCPAPANTYCSLRDAVPSCVPFTSGKPEGETCTRSSECRGDLTCFLHVDGNRCGRICCPAAIADNCGSGQSCAGSGEILAQSSIVATGWGECLPVRHCTPLQDTSKCERGEGCYLVDEDEAARCQKAGTVIEGGDCERDVDCQPGFACSGVSRSTCVRTCLLNANSTCGVGKSCVSYGKMLSPLGLCVPSVDSVR